MQDFRDSMLLTRHLPGILVASAMLALSACDRLTSTDMRFSRAAQADLVGDYATAETELIAALRRDGGNTKALIALARTDWKLGKFDAAQGYLTRAREAGAKAVELGTLPAELLLSLGKFQEALKLLDGDANQSEPLQQSLKAAAQAGQQDYKAAQSTLNLALQRTPGNAQLLLQQALVHAANGKMQDAYAALDRSLTTSPGLPAALNARGTLRFTEAHYEQAIRDFVQVADGKRGLATTVEQAQALIGMADSQLATNDLQAATTTVQRLRKIAGNSYAAHLLQGRLAMQTGDPQQAVTEFTVVNRALPRDSQAATLLGAAQLATGSIEQAMATLSAVLAAHPDQSAARKLLARSQLAGDKAGAAIATLAADGKTDDPESDRLLAAAHIKSGNAEAAVPYLERELAKAPQNPELRADLALAYLMSNQFNKAEPAIEAIPADKRDARVRSLMVLARVAGKTAAQALPALDDLVRSNARDADLLAASGVYATELGDLVAARRYLAQSLQLKPGNNAALMGLAGAEAATGDNKGATSHLQQVLSTDPNNQPALMGLARLELRQKNLPGARNWLQRAISAAPSTVPARLLLAQVEYSAGDITRGKAMLDQAMSVTTDRAGTANAAGDVAQQGGQFEDALARYNEAIGLGSQPARIGTARAQIALRRLTDARRTLEAITDEPLRLQARVLLLGLDASEDKLTEARSRIASMRKDGLAAPAADELEGNMAMLEKNPVAAAGAYARAFAAQPSQALALKVFNARMAGRLPQATDPLEQWLKSNVHDSTVRMVLGSYQIQSARWKEAIASFEAVTTDAPDIAAGWNNLGWCYAQVGDARAMQAARRAYEADGANSDYIDTYGWTLLQSGKATDALPLIEQALRKSPDNPSIRYHLAVAKSRTGNAVGAASDLRQLLATKATFEERVAGEALLKSLTR